MSSTKKLILLSDVNEQVGCDSATWQGVVGEQGVGRCNSNHLLLLKICAAHYLLIISTQLSACHSYWMQPHSKHWYLVDYVTVRRKDRQHARVTKAMCVRLTIGL